jgi:NAD(P)H-quinone oxidoreductase subunit K
VPPILTGQYLQTGGHSVPPRELMEAMGVPLPETLEQVPAQEII